MTKCSGFLEALVAEGDLLLASIIDGPRSQHYEARVKKIYSQVSAIGGLAIDDEFDFVGSTSGWANCMAIPHIVGGRSLLFLNIINSIAYESTSAGRMILETINGIDYAIYKKQAIWNNEDFPETIRAAAIQDPHREFASAIRFDALEEYIVDLLERLRGQSRLGK